MKIRGAGQLVAAGLFGRLPLRDFSSAKNGAVELLIGYRPSKSPLMQVIPIETCPEATAMQGKFSLLFKIELFL